MRAIVHANPSIFWQVDYSRALKKGLDALNIPTKITAARDEIADLRIILGPHWHIPDGILIDRAFWGDPHAVSVHWIENGYKVYDWTPKKGRYHPELQPMKKGKNTLVLCDYGKRYKALGTLRRHPAQQLPEETLEAALSRHDIAIGGRSTAMVEAAIEGLIVHTLEENTPVDPIAGKTDPDRISWIRALSWHNWTYDEIYKGTLWPHFLE